VSVEEDGAPIAATGLPLGTPKAPAGVAAGGVLPAEAPAEVPPRVKPITGGVGWNEKGGVGIEPTGRAIGAVLVLAKRGEEPGLDRAAPIPPTPLSAAPGSTECGLTRPWRAGPSVGDVESSVAEQGDDESRAVAAWLESCDVSCDEAIGDVITPVATARTSAAYTAASD
jgi:hypothetical protein